MTDPASTAEMHRLFNNAAEVYDQSGVSFFGPIGQRLVDFARIASGESVLDVGCGRGAALFPAADAVGGDGEVIGIDLSEKMIKQAKSQAQNSGLSQVETVVMNGQNPDFPPSRFDTVIGSFSVFIWVDSAEVLRPYLSLLRPGGRFAASAPSFFFTPTGDWKFLPDVVSDLVTPYITAQHADDGYTSPFADLRNNWMVTRERIDAMLTEAGFTDVEICEEHLPVVVESGTQWVDWTRSHGMRRMWQRLDENQDAELADAITQRLEVLRDSDGLITLPTPIVYIRGNAPLF